MVKIFSYLAGCFTGIVKAYGFAKRNKIAIGILIGAFIVYKFRLFGWKIDLKNFKAEIKIIIKLFYFVKANLANAKNNFNSCPFIIFI